ncbi:alanyl (membrane) aminopeptidase-like b [Xyrauchen texanus]|uniref:alanyl (membrane) aminopeptidase-like b n=1 Tax=Xyrauchen texanus TaxID=154827 RepID=UPI0022424BB5|nr:alanyl (membrane) aminopeptidase-like b [Xyrauchen texanus]
MAKGLLISKTLAAATAILTVSSVCGLVLMLVIYQIQIGKNAPVPPPSPVPSTAIPSGPPPSLRLPDNLIPESYNVFLQPYFYVEVLNNTEQSFVFKGNSTVRLKCMKKSKSIFLHVRYLNVTDVEVTNSDSNEKISVMRYEVHYNESNFLEIQLNDVLLNGTYYDLFTAFVGEHLDDLSGFYLSQYKVRGKEEEDEERFLAASQMQPTDARKVFPCFDEPALKAVFNITIIHRLNTIALSNSLADSKFGTIDGEKWVISTFEPTPVMSTYLLAFSVSDFEFKMITSGTKISTYARPDAIDAGHADYATEIAGLILDHYEKTFGLRYPLEKLDQIALPDFSEGAMENWGLIAYREAGLLYDKDTSSNFDKEWVATVIAHELAHQWFGNLVTMSWWNDLWLNEGFATYISYLGVEAAGWDLKDLIVLREIQTAFEVDSMNTSHPLSLHESNIETYSDIIEHFDDITYSKGAAVLRMLSTLMGEEDFMRGIKNYLYKFQYMNTKYTDLWKCLQEVTTKNVAGFMGTWIEQVGYPVITIITETGEISQEQFLLKQTQGHGTAWQVPVRSVKSDDLEKVDGYILRVNGPVQKPEYQITDEKWLLANINCTGFFRVNYDEKNWNRLLRQLESAYHVIPLINRGQLIDDAFNLARADRLNITIALSLTKFLLNDTEYIPWESAIKNLDYLILMFDRSEVYGPMTKYLRKQVAPLYKYFKNNTDNGSIPERHTDQYNQVNAISMACSNGHFECITMATKLFHDYKNGTNRIHPNLRASIYCSAIAAGDEDDWEFAWEEFQRATVASEKDKLRYALSCTKEIWLLNRYLQYTLDPAKIRKMDLISTINYIAKNVAGQPLAWDFVRGQWSYITEDYGAGLISLGSLIDGVTKRFSTGFELKQLRQIQQEQEEDDQEFANRALEQVIERTEANIKWVTENKQAVLDWFSES